MTSINSEEVNYLIYRYLQEAGFEHSSFVFGQESFIAKPPASDIRHSLVPPGMLISLLQKGLQYLSIEHHLKEDGTERICSKPFHLLEAHVCDDPMDVEPGEEVMVKQPAPLAKSMAPPGANNDPYDDMRSASLKSSNSNSNQAHQQQTRKKRQASIEAPLDKEPHNTSSLLIEYSAEATACAFNPKDPSMIASCSSAGKVGVHQNQKLLYTFEYEEAEVTCLQWSPDGQFLVAGTFGGNARVWNIAQGGELLHVLSHGGDAPVLSAKFHPSKPHVLATVHSNCVHIWVDSGEALKLSDHKDVVMDLDWHPNLDALATCSKDKSVMSYLLDIHIMNDDDNEKKKVEVKIKEHSTLNGHFDDVNAVRWCPHDAEVLASCSDDTTVILWKPFQNNTELHRFADHNQEIYALEWNPKEPLLATASFDKTSRVYELSTLQAKWVLEGAQQPVMSLGWSTDGKYLATGGADEHVRVYEGSDLVYTSPGEEGEVGAIFCIDWNVSSTNTFVYSTSLGKVILTSPLSVQ